jgi:23S rRNA (cytidine1920-2'-O)/16S rRNA (cytidine1409-2'-O)-methyltransferase
LVERGLAESRARAQALIMAGLVTVGGRRVDKAGALVPPDAAVTVTGPDHPWVSRGGLKLAHALDHFAIDPAGWRCLDLGASTGGFTDVLLARGAAHVTAVDVGRGQLHWRLRQDPRVTVRDGLNARALNPAHLDGPPDLIVCDASFIGLATLLPAALALAAPDARLVALIKPQFEAGPSQVGKGGIVRDPAVHAEVCQRVTDWLASVGWPPSGLTPSPVAGRDGNREFLVAATRRDGGAEKSAAP